jgi:hypothetical protein
MASTVSAATMTVKITEDIVLNGVNQGGTSTQSIGSINEVHKFIKTVDTAGFRTLVLFDNTVAAGTLDADLVKYVRVTNLDDTNYIDILVRATDSFVYRVTAGSSIVLGGGTDSALEGVASGDAGASGTDIIKISGQANTASVDVEVFVAST